MRYANSDNGNDDPGKMPGVKLLFVNACICVGMAVLLFVADARQITAGPVEIGSWGRWPATAMPWFITAGRSFGKTPLASLAIPLTLPLVGWIVLAAKRPSRRRGFPVANRTGEPQ